MLRFDAAALPMSNDEHPTEEATQALSGSYLVFAIVLGFGIIGVIAVAGAMQWPLIPTLLIGAAAQTVFRISKRTWSNALAGNNAAEGDGDRLLSAAFIKTLALIYAAMIAVSALWYGVGWGANWLWRAIF